MATFRLISKTILSSTTSSVIFSSIPNSYRDLKLIISASTTFPAENTSNQVAITFNSDTNTNNYAYKVLYAGTQFGSITNSNTGGNQIFFSSRSSQPLFTNTEIYIAGYASSQITKPISVLSSTSFYNNASFIEERSGYWYSLGNQISSIQLSIPSYSLFTGSGFYLYGIS